MFERATLSSFCLSNLDGIWRLKSHDQLFESQFMYSGSVFTRPEQVLDAFYMETSGVLQTGMASVLSAISLGRNLHIHLNDNLISTFKIFGKQKKSLDEVLEIEVFLLDVTELLQSYVSKEKETQLLLQNSYIMIHDLKAPVSNLYQLLDLLKECGDEEEKSLLFKHAVLCVSKIDEVRKGIESRLLTAEKPDRISLKKTLHDLFFSHLLKPENFRLQCQPDFEIDSKIKLNVDSIFGNLISNSIKYANTEQLLIEIRVENIGHQYLIVFKDNGHGLDDSMSVEDLFKLGVRSSISQVQGKGMGLYMVKSQLNLIGGRIVPLNQKDTGLTYYIWLPV